MTRKINSTESQIFPKEVEWRFAPTSWAYRAGQDILYKGRKIQLRKQLCDPQNCRLNRKRFNSLSKIWIQIYWCCWWGLWTCPRSSVGKDESREIHRNKSHLWQRTGMKRNESERRKGEGLLPAFMWTSDEPRSPLKLRLYTMSIIQTNFPKVQIFFNRKILNREEEFFSFLIYFLQY